MLRLLAVAPVLLLQGCFFFYVPGSFIDAAADAATGKEGLNCVTSSAKVGDTVRMPDNSYWKVEKIEGTSYRCRDSALPIRAKLAPI
jgi:hypothetical protein